MYGEDKLAVKNASVTIQKKNVRNLGFNLVKSNCLQIWNIFGEI